MDEKKLKSELKECIDGGLYYLAQIHLLDLVANDKKSRKTEEKNEMKRCRFKHLYATKKFGCSGFKEDDECFICEYRK